MITYLIAFKAEEDADRKKVYDTANFYHFIHTLAILAVPLTKRPVLVSFIRLFHSFTALWSVKILRFINWGGFIKTLTLFSEWDIDHHRNNNILWNNLLPRINKWKTAKKIYAIWRNSTYAGMVEHGIVKAISKQSP